MKRTLAFSFMLWIVFLGLISPAFCDTAYLQLDRNEYYETSEVSYNMEDMINSSHLYDFGLNDNHGDMDSGLSFVDGYFGQALNGWSANPPYNVTIPNLNLQSADYTIMMWVYPTSVTLKYLTFSVGASGYFYIKFSTTGNITFISGLDTITSKSSVQVNQWTHIACVNDPSNSTYDARIYFNGSLVSGAVGNWREQNYNNHTYIGDNYDGALHRYYFQGKIDEFRIYKGEARTQEEILEDMDTPIALELTVEDLEPDEDIVQLWFENETLFEQQTANSNGTVQFNVWEFSDHNSTYNGVLNVYHTDIQYEGYVMVLNWGDVYSFVVLGVFEDLFTQFLFGSGAWIGLTVLMAIMFITSAKVKYIGAVFGVVAFFIGIVYFQNVASNLMFMWAGVLMWVCGILLVFIGIAGAKK